MDKEICFKNAPHTAQMMMKPEWNHPFLAKKAVYPLEWLRGNKFCPWLDAWTNGLAGQKFGLFLVLPWMIPIKREKKVLLIRLDKIGDLICTWLSGFFFTRLRSSVVISRLGIYS